MNEQTTEELTRLLNAEDREVGFLQHLPPEAVARLAGAISGTIETEKNAIETAVAEGTQRLPKGLRGIVRSILS